VTHNEVPFWKRKALGAMSRAEWESLCDGCGRCCLHKIRWADEDGVEGALDHTNVACRLLDLKSCRCRDYTHRSAIVPDCTQLTPENVPALDWLPPSCAYRRLAEGRDLPWWHHLVCGDRDMVHRVGASVRGRAVAERGAGPLQHHIVAWPGEPVRARKPKEDPAR
jgi:uncharacterized cysteine cluster protein YcgN (CxxCxxCC family)